MILKLKFKVTNYNIRLRHEVEKLKTPGYGIKQFCERFDIIKNLAYKWMSPNHIRVPNDRNKCPICSKTKLDIVYEWINDGTLTDINLVKKITPLLKGFERTVK